MSLTKSDFSAILKTDYKGPIRDLLNNTCLFLSRMERNTENTGGNFCYLPLRTGRTGSIGARNDGASEQLPVGGKPTYGNATFDVKSLYATVRITGKVIRASKNKNTSFAQAQVRLIEDTVKDYKKDINRQLFGDATAELCLVTATSADDISYNGATVSGQVYTVDSNLYPTNPTKFLYSGMIVDVRAVTTGTVISNGDSLTVASVLSSTLFTAAGASAPSTSNAAVYREDNAATNEIKEIYGLAAIVDPSNPSALYTSTRVTANFGGINRSTNPEWRGQELSNSGVLRPFSINLVEQAIDLADISCGAQISLIQTNHAIFRIYGNILAIAKTIDMAKMSLDGGWNALGVNDIPMVKDVECPDYHIFCLDEVTFQLAVTGDYEWIEDDGGGVLTRLAGQDQYEGVLARDCQLMCDNPQANVKITDVSHS